MRARTGVLVGLLVLAAVVAALAAATLTRSTPAYVAQGGAPPRGVLEACVPPGTETSHVPNDAIVTCLAQALAPLARTSGLPAVDTAIDFDPPNATFFAACHDAAHRVGRATAPSYPDLSLAIGQVLDSCGAGLLHGVLDEAALKPVADDQAQRSVLICSEQVDVGLCADALGHLFWTSSGDFDLAVERCATFPRADDVTKCVEGVMMRMYLPQDDASTHRFTADELSALCAQPWRNEPDGARAACASQVAVAAVNQWLDPVVTALAARDFPLADLTLADDGLRSADGACGRLTSDALVQACRVGVATTASGRHDGSGLFRAYACLRLPGQYQQACLAVPPVVDDATIARAASVREA